MPSPEQLAAFLDEKLESGSVKDSSRNGLQVAGFSGNVRKAAFGVSASLEMIRRSADWGADIIITHHGLIWDEPQRITGPFAEKVSLLLEKRISLCAWHLPLDRHPSLGNNAGLLKLLGASRLKPFGLYKGQTIGMSGLLKKPLPAERIADILKKKMNSAPCSFLFGPRLIHSVAAVSGGAASMFTQAAEQGFDLYLTGETAEQSRETAREYRANFMAAGHYNSEKTGVQALEKLLRRSFGLKTAFIDIPNPA